LALALFSTKRTRYQLHGAEVTADITNTVTAARVQNTKGKTLSVPTGITPSTPLGNPQHYW